MKKLILLAAIAFAFGAQSFLQAPDPELLKINSALVQNIEGLYVFTDCMPARPYEVLGEVSASTGTFESPQYEVLRNKLIKKALHIPGSNGIIIQLKYGGLDRATVIKLKE